MKLYKVQDSALQAAVSCSCLQIILVTARPGSAPSAWSTCLVPVMHQLCACFVVWEGGDIVSPCSNRASGLEDAACLWPEGGEVEAASQLASLVHGN